MEAFSQSSCSVQSESTPLFKLHTNVKHYNTSVDATQSLLNKYYLSWMDVIIISFVSTINNLIFKSWFVFSAFIDIDYNIKFYELSWALAFMQLSALPTIFVIPYLNSFKCNWLCLMLMVLASSCSLLNAVLPGSVFNIFIISFVRCLLVQVFWTYGNSITYQFMPEKRGEEKWRKNTATTIFMGAWTYSSVLFLIIGVLIDQYGFQLSLFMTTVFNICLSILMFYRLPAISLNAFIELEATVNTDEESDEEEDILPTPTEIATAASGGRLAVLWSYVKSLTSDALVMVIMMNILACVTNWGMYYGCFGPWLQELFHLNAKKLSVYVTLCEAVAEFIALFAIPIIARHVANAKLCLIGGALETASVVLFNVLLWNDGHILKMYVLTLHSQWLKIGIVLFCIFSFYMGHEFLYVSLMVNLEVVPKKQYNTAVAMYGLADFSGAVIGQMFVTYVYTDHGMAAMAPVMLMVEGLSVSCLIAMRIVLHFRNKTKPKTEEDIDGESKSESRLMMKSPANESPLQSPAKLQEVVGIYAMTIKERMSSDSSERKASVISYETCYS